MPRTAYPTDTDLSARLTAAGIDTEIVAALQTAGAINDVVLAAAAEWENATGWRPYLATDTATQRTFAAPVSVSGGGFVAGTRLDLPEPLLVLSQITAGGRVLVAGRDYIAGPSNAPTLWLTFAAKVNGTVVVTGRWGRVAAIPDNVWDAILQQAQALLAPDIEFAVSGGVTEVKADFVTVKFGGATEMATKLRESRWKRLVESNRRVAF